MMGAYGYGGTSGGVAYPYGESSSFSSSASAPPFMSDHLPHNTTPPPAEFRDFFAESFHPHAYPNPSKFSVPEFEFDERTSYDSSHLFHAAWPHNPGYSPGQQEVQQNLGFHVYHGVPPPPLPSLLPYADVNGVGSCVSRGKDSYSNMFLAGDVLTSRGQHVTSAASADPYKSYLNETIVDFVPLYDSGPSVPWSSSKIPESCYPQEPYFQPIEPRGYDVSSNAFYEKFSKQHFASHDGLASMNAIPHLPMEPEINIPNTVAPLPISSMERLDCSKIKGRIGVRDPIQSGRSIPENLPKNVLAAESSIQCSRIDPVSLLGSNDVTGHVKPLFEAPDFHSQTADSQCRKGPGVSHSPPLKPTSSSPLLKDKSERSSGSSQCQGLAFLAIDTDDDDVVESSLKNPRDTLRPDENRFWNQFMAYVSEGPSVPELSEENELRDAIKVLSRKAQSVVSQAPCSLDDINKPINKGVQANLDSCTNLKQTHTEDIVRSEKKNTFGGVLNLEDGSSNVNDVSNCDTSYDNLRAVGDSSSLCSSLKVDSVVKTMHNLSELLAHRCSNNGNMLKEQELETLRKVVNNLNNCLKNTTGQKAKTGEASLPKQALSESSPDLVMPLEVPEAATADIQGRPLDQHVKARKNKCDAYGYSERVKNDEMAQSIKKILASNFPDDKQMQPQVLLFKNLWLEAEAALCSTTYMARFHRVSEEMENLHFCGNTKETSSDAKFASEREQCPCEGNDGEKKTTDGIVPDSSVTDANSYEKNLDVRTRSHAQRSWGYNLDTVDALLASISESFSSLPLDIYSTNEKILETKTQNSHIAGASSSVNDFMDGAEQHPPTNNVDSEEKNGQRPTWDAPDNLESSVMARFQILKCRPDHFTTFEKLTVEDEGKKNGSVDGRGSPSSDWEHVAEDEVPEQSEGLSLCCP